MPVIDYSAPADYYPGRRGGRKTPLRFRRFDSIAEAIRHAIEEAPPSQLGGTLIESEELRYEGDAITALYRSKDYPLPRGATAAGAPVPAA